MKIKKIKMFIISMLILCFALSIMPMKVLANSEIGDVDIEGVTFNYNPSLQALSRNKIIFLKLFCFDIFSYMLHIGAEFFI